LPRRGCIEAVPKFGRVRPAPTGDGEPRGPPGRWISAGWCGVPNGPPRRAPHHSGEGPWPNQCARVFSLRQPRPVDVSRRNRATHYLPITRVGGKKDNQRPQSSSSSRVTAGCAAFFILSQSGERPLGRSPPGPQVCYRWAAPFRPEGSDDSLHQAPRLHHAARRLGGRLAASGAGAAGGAADGSVRRMNDSAP
jgi:hypothetical protein